MGETTLITAPVGLYPPACAVESTLDSVSSQLRMIRPSEARAFTVMKAGVYFHGVVYGASGYAEEGWMEALGVADSGIPVQLHPLGDLRDSRHLLPAEARRRLHILHRNRVDLAQSVYFQSAPAQFWDFSRAGRVCVGRTMFEADGLPDGWKDLCERMDEVWVPSRFNLETFSNAGVSELRLRWMPAGVDTCLFRPGTEPLEIPGKRGFNFLSVFDWHPRKGYDVLLKAYMREFKPDEDVALMVKIYQMQAWAEDVESTLIHFIESEVGLPLEKTPPLILLNGYIPQKDMPRLYASGDAYVLPSRGEGYCRPYMEAMACGIPVIATRWSGHLDYLNDGNGYLIDLEGLSPVPLDTRVEFLAGQNWAEPSIEHLQQLMRQVFNHREEARARALLGRQKMVDEYDWEVTNKRLVSGFRYLLD